MAVSSTDLSKRYNCNGSTTEFPITFDYLDTEALVQVLLYSTSLGTYTELTLDTDYTIADDAVTTTSTYSTGYDLLLKLDFTDAITQLTDWVENDKFTSGSWETALDRVTLVCQWLAEGLSRCIQGPFGDADDVSWAIGETASERANGYIRFNDDGTGLAIATGVTPSTATVTAYVETLLDDTSASAFLATLGVGTYIQGLLDEASAASARTYLGATASTDTIEMARSVEEGGSSGALKPYVFDISNWNMDASTSVIVSIPAEISLSFVRSWSIAIIPDGETYPHYILPAANVAALGGGGTEVEAEGWISSGSFLLARRTGGFFDSSLYDASPFNRGYITLWYLD